jgi:hypothetical protein
MMERKNVPVEKIIEKTEEFGRLFLLLSRLNRAKSEIENANIWYIADELTFIIELFRTGEIKEGMNRLDKLAALVMQASDRDHTIYLFARELLSCKQNLKERIRKVRENGDGF